MKLWKTTSLTMEAALQNMLNPHKPNEIVENHIMYYIESVLQIILTSYKLNRIMGNYIKNRQMNGKNY